MSHVQTDVLDVVIIGGGLVGGLTALLLATRRCASYRIGCCTYFR